MRTSSIVMLVAAGCFALSSLITAQGRGQGPSGGRGPQIARGGGSGDRTSAVVAVEAAEVVATQASNRATPVAVAVLAQTPATGAAVGMRAAAGMPAA